MRREEKKPQEVANSLWSFATSGAQPAWPQQLLLLRLLLRLRCRSTQAEELTPSWMLVRDDARSSSGMTLRLPESPRFASDSFTATATASLVGVSYGLMAWQITLTFDSNTNVAGQTGNFDCSLLVNTTYSESLANQANLAVTKVRWVRVA